MNKVQGYKTLEEAKINAKNDLQIWSLEEDKDEYIKICTMAGIDHKEYPYCVKSTF